MNIKEIREAALAATPGPWKSRKGFHVATIEVFKPDRSIKKPFYPTQLAEVRTDDKEGKANAKHIVTANPATVIAMCDEIERLRAKVEPA